MHAVVLCNGTRSSTNGTSSDFAGTGTEVVPFPKRWNLLENIDIDLDIENESLENVDIDIEPEFDIVPCLLRDDHLVETTDNVESGGLVTNTKPID